MTTPFFSGIIRVLAGTDFVALVPVQYARRVAEREGLAIYRAPMDMAAPEISMYWHRRSSNTPGHRWFRGKVAEILRALDEGG